MQDTAIATLARAAPRRRAPEPFSTLDDRKAQPRGKNEPQLKFTREEYAERLAKTRQAMEAKGVDLLIVSDPSNMAWLTGYDGWSFYVHQCVLVPPDGEPVWFGRGQDANGAKRTAYLADDNIVGYPDHYVQSTERHPMDYLSQVIWRTRLGQAARSASRWTTTGSPPPPSPSLQKHLPNARFVDATGTGELAARGQVADRSSTTCARPRASSRRCTRASSR